MEPSVAIELFLMTDFARSILFGLANLKELTGERNFD
jgi:hypothetical protein